MKLTPGEVYFVIEHDVKTKVQSPYVKIGIVESDPKEKRTSQERALEHQTGNPRKISVFHILKTELVRNVENKLHRYFAKNRIKGEWFEFTSEMLQQAVKQAEVFVQMAGHDFEVLSNAQSLDTQLSTQIVKESSEDLKKMKTSLLELKEKLKVCKNLDNEYRAFISNLPEEKFDSVATIQNPTPKEVFDKDAFKESEPLLWDSFQVSDETFSHTFRLDGVRKFEVDLEINDPNLHEFKLKFQVCLEQSRANEEKIEELQELFFELRNLSSGYEYEAEVLESRIKVECGLAKAIKDVCTWERFYKKSQKFDEASFKLKHPDVWSKFTKTKIPSDKLIPAKY